MTDCLKVEPKGKRAVRRNAYGHMHGYIGGRKWECINGCGIDPYTDAEAKACAAWLAGDPDWQIAPWM